MDVARTLLAKHWGFDDFRGVQEPVIRTLIEKNEDAVIVMPTGGGKSLTFQIPSLVFEGLTICVSPLIALMKDQTDALRARNVPAATLDSTLTLEQSAMVKDDLRNGRIKLLYVSPERLNNELFLEMIGSIGKISLLAVDEAHCVAEWGPSFRPEYLKVARFAKEIQAERVLCLTATATPAVAKAILAGFNIPPENLFRSSTYRPNLSLRAQTAHTFEDKIKALVPLLQKRTGAAIVYVTAQYQSEELVARLHREKGLEDAMFYHAGMKTEDRTKVQEKFIREDKSIVCSTIAFGMGIDKSNIRIVCHFNLSKTLEGYSQEIGRAGRDGKPSDCLLFLAEEDLPTLEGFARGNTPSKRSLQAWLQEVTKAVAQPEDGCLVFNLHEMSRSHDIRQNTLGLLFAELELNFHLFRAVTPFYGEYVVDGSVAHLSPRCKTSNAQAVLACFKFGTKLSTLNVLTCSATTGLTRSDISRQVGFFERELGLQVRGQQVRNRYRVLQDMPTDPAKIDSISTQLYEEMLKREEKDVERLQAVVDWATADECLASGLAAYFGDDDAVPGGMCGHCSYCVTCKPTVFGISKKPAVDTGLACCILDACPYRDDARLLARVAHGIASPRTTALKLRGGVRGSPFGSMDTTDFLALVEYFDGVCQSAGYRNPSNLESIVTSKAAANGPAKRPYGATAASKRRGPSSSTPAKRSKLS